ncbi:MAG: hypothetical protein HY777_04015 [Betaproteobacteria bacterium]|nr:hypothetical protein [Betaproteobacteria bacterium]
MGEKNSVQSSHLEEPGANSLKMSSPPNSNPIDNGVVEISGIGLKCNIESQGCELDLLAGKLFLNAIDVSKLLEITVRSVQKNAVSGRFPGAQKVTENGVEVWRIPFGSLPAEAQTRYLQERAPRRTPEEEKSYIRSLNAKTVADAQADAIAGRAPARTKLLPVPILDDAQSAALWKRWEPASNKEKDKAKRALLRMQAWDRHAKAGLVIKSEIEAAIRAEFGDVETSHATLWRYRQRIEGQPRDLWAVLLLAEYCGGKPAIELEPDAWQWFVSEWGIQSKPHVSVVYRRYKAEAVQRGWKIPSVDWFADRINTIPIPVQTYLRDGNKSLQEALPPIVRDYEKLPMHSIWCSDFRRLDVWCWMDGEVCQPHMIAWQELRTRKILAWRLVKNPNPDAVRLCFRDALLANDSMPMSIYVDNGMEYAAKCNTGGATRRNRFKKRDDDVWGLFTLLNVKIIWSTPGHAWAKPIESFWAGFKQGLENRREFEGAYKGASPDQRPENAAPNKEKAAAVAIPEARIKELIAEEVNGFHGRGHRGHGMNSRSPNDVWAELQATPELLHRKPNDQQLKLCLARMEAVKLDRYGQFTLQGSKYGSEKLATERLPNVTYTVLFDPDNLSRPVSVLLNGEPYGEAAPIGPVQFGDTEAVREHSKHKARYRKAIKAVAEAHVGMTRAKVSAPKQKKAEPQPLPEKQEIAAIGEAESADSLLMRPPEGTQDESERQAEIDADFRAWREAESKKPSPYFDD